MRTVRHVARVRALLDDRVLQCIHQLVWCDLCQATLIAHVLSCTSVIICAPMITMPTLSCRTALFVKPSEPRSLWYPGASQSGSTPLLLIPWPTHFTRLWPIASAPNSFANSCSERERSGNPALYFLSSDFMHRRIRPPESKLTNLKTQRPFDLTQIYLGISGKLLCAQSNKFWRELSSRRHMCTRETLRFVRYGEREQDHIPRGCSPLFGMVAWGKKHWVFLLRGEGEVVSWIKERLKQFKPKMSKVKGLKNLIQALVSCKSFPPPTGSTSPRVACPLRVTPKPIPPSGTRSFTQKP